MGGELRCRGTSRGTRRVGCSEREWSHCAKGLAQARQACHSQVPMVRMDCAPPHQDSRESKLSHQNTHPTVASGPPVLASGPTVPPADARVTWGGLDRGPTAHTPAAPAQPSLPLGAGKRSLLPCFGDFSTMLDDKLNSSVKIAGVRGYLPSNAHPLGRAVTPAGLPTVTMLVAEAALKVSSDKEEGDSFGLPEEGLRRRPGGRRVVGSLRSAQL